MKQILSFTLLLLLAACNNAKQEGEHEHHHGHDSSTVIPAEAHEHEGSSTTVALDNGKKWKANIETTEGIEKMKSLTQGAIAENKTPQNLLPALQHEFKTIFDKCTMTGEAHNQLHNYLIPVKTQLDSLKSATASSKNLEDLQHYLETYPQYFE